MSKSLDLYYWNSFYGNGEKYTRKKKRSKCKHAHFRSSKWPICRFQLNIYVFILFNNSSFHLSIQLRLRIHRAQRTHYDLRIFVFLSWDPNPIPNSKCSVIIFFCSFFQFFLLNGATIIQQSECVLHIFEPRKKQ